MYGIENPEFIKYFIEDFDFILRDIRENTQKTTLEIVDQIGDIIDSFQKPYTEEQSQFIKNYCIYVESAFPEPKPEMIETKQIPPINVNGNNNSITIAANNSTVKSSVSSGPSPIRDCTIIPNYIFETILKLHEPIDIIDWNIVYSIGKRLYHVDGASFPTLKTIGKECGCCSKSAGNRLEVLEKKKIFKIKNGQFDNTTKKRKVNNYEWYGRCN